MYHEALYKDEKVASSLQDFGNLDCPTDDELA